MAGFGLLGRIEREHQRADARHVLSETYADACLPSPEAQRGLLERLRFHGYVRAETLGRFMQRIGDFGREWFPFVGHGWDGIGRR